MINCRLQEIFHTTDMFGGLSVIVFGDFNQLRPVLDSWIFKVNQRDDLSVLTGPYLWNLFVIYDLDEIMRQKDDKKFAIALNHLGNGEITDEEYELFQSREITRLNKNQKQKISIPPEAIHLFETNKEIDSYNRKFLENLNAESCIIEAVDVCVGNVPLKKKDNILKKIKTMPVSKTNGLPREINAKLSARYMITVNVDTTDGLTNGACGRLRHIAWGCNNKGEKVPVRLYLQFEDNNIGKKAREKWRQSMYNTNINEQWTPIEYVIRTIVMRQNTIHSVMRKQFPLTPAEAMTIHKSQGSTFSSIVLHTNKQKCMEQRMLYVACSRVTSINGLFIDGKFKFSNSRSSNPVKKQIEYMKRYKMLKLELVFPQEIKTSDNTLLMFQNIRSLHKHLIDLQYEKAFLSADILILVETWTLSEDNLNFGSFQCILRRDCISRRKPRGNAVLVKDNIQNQIKTFYSKFENGIDVNGILIKGNYAILYVYSTPRALYKNLESLITDAILHARNITPALVNIILIGDFNINLMDSKSTKTKNFKACMSALKLSLSTPTNIFSTIYNTQIDFCFSLYEVVSGYYETFYSDHKAIWIIL